MEPVKSLNLSTGRQVQNAPKGSQYDAELNAYGTPEQLARYQHSKGSSEFYIRDRIYSAYVSRVKDGDSVWLSLNLKFKDVFSKIGWFKGCFSLKLHCDFRMYGYDAYEKGTPLGDKAAAWLENAIKPNQKVYIVFVDPEKYGREMGYLFLTKSDARKNIYTIRDELIKQGVAYEYYGGKKQPHP